jgi:hypothetical protein
VAQVSLMRNDDCDRLLGVWRSVNADVPNQVAPFIDGLETLQGNVLTEG